MADRLYTGVSKVSIDAYYATDLATLFPEPPESILRGGSLFEIPPSRPTVEGLIDSLRRPGSSGHALDRYLVREMLSKLLGVSPTELPDRHPELVAFGRLEREAMVDRLINTFTASHFAAAFPEASAANPPLGTMKPAREAHPATAPLMTPARPSILPTMPPLRDADISPPPQPFVW